jgi:hypothetical protein
MQSSIGKSILVIGRPSKNAAAKIFLFEARAILSNYRYKAVKAIIIIFLLLLMKITSK